MLRTVKIVVLVMSALIVIGLALLAYGLMTKGTGEDAIGQDPQPIETGSRDISTAHGIVEADVTRTSATEIPGFGMLFLDEPEGTTVKSMSVSGNILVIELIGGPQFRPNRLIVVDIDRGVVLGRINLGSAL